jgi:hypothetical protein
MRKRKLQIFLSSTYEDLVDHRLTAMEAILAAGHIPAAMEQFTPGDETAWQKITTWIDESDAFILILGGRYGSVEPESGKSYVQLEYEYAIEKRKPFFALVVKDEHHEQRIRELGLKVDERENPESYKKFKNTVTQKLCAFWSDKKDIKSAIFQKLPEWAQRPDLIGWVRSDEAANPEVMNEFARLSHENRELREQMKASEELFDGLPFDQFVRLLAEHGVSRSDMPATFSPTATNLLELFFEKFKSRADGSVRSLGINNLRKLVGFGLVGEQVGDVSQYSLSELGRRLRNRLAVERRSKLSPTPKRTPSGS